MVVKLHKLFSEEKGSISIYLMIMLTAVLVIIFGIIDLSRVNYSKNKVQRAMMIAGNSVLAGYCKEIKDEYGLLCIRDLDDFVIEENFKKYLEKNLISNDMSKLDIMNLFISDEKTLLDHDELLKQIETYMSVRKVETLSGLYSRIKSLKNSISNVGTTTEKMEKEQVNPVSEDEYESIEYKKDDDNREEIRDKVKDELDKSKYNNDVVIPDDVMNTLPSRLIKYEEEVKCHEEKMMKESKDMLKKLVNNMDFYSDLYLDEYIMMKFKNMHNQVATKYARVFDYEVEYIISGNVSQNENIKGIKSKILKNRQIFNLMYVYDNEELKAEVALIAQALANFFASPMRVTAIKNALLYTIALDMSITDLNKLMDGEKIRFIRDKELFVDYNDYMRILLILTPREEKVDRIKDLIHINMKKINMIFDIRNARVAFNMKVTYNEKYLFMTRMLIPKYIRFNGGEELVISQKVAY